MPLIRVPIFIVKYMVTNAPLVSLVIFAEMIAYYLATRILWGEIRSYLRKPVTPSNQNLPAKEADPTSPVKLYNSSTRFFLLAAEFLILLTLLGLVAQVVGVIPDFGTALNKYISGSGDESPIGASSGQTTQSVPTISKQDDPPAPAVSAASVSQEKFKIPLDFESDCDLSIPPGTVGKMGSDEGMWDPLTSVFDPPIHPIGSIKSLSCKGKAIALMDTKLKSGIISTQDFGDIEVFLLGIRRGHAQLEFRATVSSIRKMIQVFGT